MSNSNNQFTSLIKKATPSGSITGSFGGQTASNSYYNSNIGTGQRFDLNNDPTKSTTSNTIFAQSSFSKNQNSQSRQNSNSGRTSNTKLKLTPN